MRTDQIKIEAIISKNLDKIWEYWILPEHITQWNFADPSWHCPSAENDLRVGGTYKARMEAKDKSFGFNFEATYDEIIEQKKIIYTMTDKRKVTTYFESLKKNTKVTIIFDAESENPIEMQKQGWQAILNNFKKYAEAN